MNLLHMNKLNMQKESKSCREKTFFFEKQNQNIFEKKNIKIQRKKKL